MGETREKKRESLITVREMLNTIRGTIDKKN